MWGILPGVNLVEGQTGALWDRRKFQIDRISGGYRMLNWVPSTQDVLMIRPERPGHGLRLPWLEALRADPAPHGDPQSGVISIGTP